MNFNVVVGILAVWLSNVSALTKYYMDENCGRTVDISNMESLRLQLTSGKVYQSNMNCSLRITSLKNKDQFMLYFQHFEIVSSPGCSQDSLEVHDGASETSPYVTGLRGKLCGSAVSRTVLTTVGPNIYLHFKSGNSLHRKGFKMVITQFHTGTCNASEFYCGNGRCISDSLLCNGYNPCGDYTDCVVVLVAGIAAGIIVAVVCGSIVVCFAMVCCVLVCMRRRRRRINRVFYQPIVVSAPNYGTGYN